MSYWDDEEGPYYTYAEALLADMQERWWRYERVKELPQFLKDEAQRAKTAAEPKPSAQRYRHLQADVPVNAKSVLMDLKRALPDEVTIDHVYWPNETKGMMSHRVIITPIERHTRPDAMQRDAVITDVTFNAKLFGEKHVRPYVLSLYPGYRRPIIRLLGDFKAQRKLQQRLEFSAEAA